MTDKQLAIIKNLTRNLMLALDADAAGEEAISRSGEMVDKMLSLPFKDYFPMNYDPASMLFQDAQHFFEIKFEVKVFVLPPGKDPDEVIRENASQWQELIKNAKPMIDFILESATAKVDLTNARDKSLAVEKLLPLLSQMKDSIWQAHYVEKLARLLKIDEHDLRDAWKKFRATERRRKTTKDKKAYTPIIPAITSSSPLEQYCLALLLQYPELKAESTGLSPDHFENTENRELFVKWQQSDDLASLRNSLDTALQEYLESLLAKTLSPPFLKENEIARRETFNDCVNLLRKNMLKNLEVKKQELFIEAQMGGIEAHLAKVDEQGIEVSKQLKDLFIKLDHRRQLSRRDEQ